MSKALINSYTMCKSIVILGDKLEKLLLSSLNQVVSNLSDGQLNWDEFKSGDLTYSPKTYDYQLNCLPRLLALLEKSELAIRASLEQLGEMVRDQINLDGESQSMIDQITFSRHFLNISLKDTVLLQHCKPILSQNASKMGFDHLGRKVLVDYSGPNIAKSLHIGHLRSTIIGEALVNLLRFAGHQVDGINHLGDWGTQFGMLLAYLKKTNADLDHGITTKPTILSQLENVDSVGLTSLYRQAKSEFDASSEFAGEARKQTALLQSGDQANLAIWQRICEISRTEYQSIYRTLNIKNLQERGESSYGPLIPKVVELLDQTGLTEMSDGAKIIRVDGFDYPQILVKNDGAYTYATTDLAALYYRTQIAKYDRIIYVTDSGQNNHFAMNFEIAKKAGWVDGCQLEHIGFGAILGADGKKLKTRSGTTVLLTDVIEEVCRESLSLLQQRKLESTEEYYTTLKEEDLLEIARRVGVNTLKYHDLQHNFKNTYKFNPKVMFQFNGDTGVYLMYVVARINSLLNKSQYGTVTVSLEETFNGQKLSSPEHALLFHMTKFPKLIWEVAVNLSLSGVLKYAYQLAHFYNLFLSEKILGSEHEQFKVGLCQKTRALLLQIFELLSFEPVEHL